MVELRVHEEGSGYDVTARQRAQEQLVEREHWYRQLLDSVPAAIYTTDSAGRITYYNDAAAKLAGRTPVLGNDEWCVTWRLYTLDGDPLPHEQCPMAVALKENRPVRDTKIVALRPDGSRVIVKPYPTPLRDAQGRLTGAVNLLVDISRQEIMDRQFRENEAILRAVFDATPECIKIVARDGTLLRMNQAGLEMIEAPFADVVLGKSTYDLIAPEHREMWRLYHGRICNGESLTWEFDIVGLCGTRLPMETHAAPLQMPDGTTAQLAVTRDVSARKRAEAQRRLLLNELNHRFKNSLVTVQSVVTQTIGRAKTVDEAKAIAEARLIALSHAHDLLMHENWQGANLVDVVEGSLVIHCGHPGRFTIDGPPLRLKPKSALSFSMIIHELCTNATKYGALSNEAGRIAVRWDCEGVGSAARLRLTWQESGGPAVKPPEHKGFGSRLIERTASLELRGEAETTYAPTGVVCHIDVLLSAVQAG